MRRTRQRRRQQRPDVTAGPGRYRTRVTSAAGPAAPAGDAEVAAFWRALGRRAGHIHVHFLPPRMLRRGWAYFDEAGPLVGVTWPVRYK